jgi:hypothetical protein
VAAIYLLMAACGSADHDFSEADGVRAAFNEAQKHRPLTSAEMLRRAESSFSPVAFGVQYDELSRLGLNMIDFGDCRQNRVCTWLDAQNVEHEADDENGLASKAIMVDPESTQNLNALGIGRARSRKDVVRAVGRFLPGMKLDCRRAPPDAEGVWCDALAGDGFVMLTFDDENRLAVAQVEAKLPQ